MDSFSYEEREAYLHQEEQRRDNDARMREGPIVCVLCSSPVSHYLPGKNVDGCEDLGDDNVPLCEECYREYIPHLTGEDVLRGRMIAGLENILEGPYQNDRTELRDLLTKLKEGEL